MLTKNSTFDVIHRYGARLESNYSDHFKQLMRRFADGTCEGEDIDLLRSYYNDYLDHIAVQQSFSDYVQGSLRHDLSMLSHLTSVEIHATGVRDRVDFTKGNPLIRSWWRAARSNAVLTNGNRDMYKCPQATLYKPLLRDVLAAMTESTIRLDGLKLNSDDDYRGFEVLRFSSTFSRILRSLRSLDLNVDEDQNRSHQGGRYSVLHLLQATPGLQELSIEVRVMLDPRAYHSLP